MEKIDEGIYQGELAIQKAAEYKYRSAASTITGLVTIASGAAITFAGRHHEDVSTFGKGVMLVGVFSLIMAAGEWGIYDNLQRQPNTRTW